MKYIIKTTYPCVVKTQNECVEIDENSSVECEDESFVYVYPEQNGIPFCINLKEKKDCENYSFLTHNRQNFVFLEPQQSFSITKKEQISINGKNCKILIDKKQISFEGQSRIVYHSISHPVKKYKILKFQNFACVQFDNDFYAYDMQKEKLYHISGEDFALDKNTLTVTKIYNDCSSRERVYKVVFSDKILIENSTFVKKEQKESDLIPYEFLQAVKAEDYSCALGFLNEKLKEKIGKTELESFFGKIQQILPINLNEFIVFSQCAKFYVSFDIKDRQICDISLDKL